MALSNNDQIKVQKFFLKMLKEMFETQEKRKNFYRQSTVELSKIEQLQLSYHPYPLSKIDAEIILSAYRKATAETQKFAQKIQLDFNDVKFYLTSLIEESLRPIIKQHLKINEQTPLAISNGKEAVWVLVNKALNEMQAKLPEDDFFEKYAAEIEAGKKALFATGLLVGAALILGGLGFLAYKAITGDNEPSPSSSPSPSI